MLPLHPPQSASEFRIEPGHGVTGHIERLGQHLEKLTLLQGVRINRQARTPVLQGASTWSK